MQINNANLADLFRGYRTQFMKAYQGADPIWPQIAMKTPSSAKQEKYAWLGSLPGMAQLLGDIPIQNVSASDYTITNNEFQSTIGVKQFDIETDTYGLYGPMFASLGAAAMQHPDDLLAQMLIDGFTTGIDYTGSPFFSSSLKYPQKGKAGFINAGNQTLSIQNFISAKANIKGRKNAQNRSMNLGKKLLLVVTPADEDLAKTICIADYDPYGATNINKGAADVVVFNALTTYSSDRPWFLLEVGMEVRPLIVQFNQEAKLLSLTNPDSDHVFKNHEFLYQAYGRYNTGYGLPELAYGSTGTVASSTPALQPPSY